MAYTAINKRLNKEKRRARIRAKMFGTLERPRLSVFKSLNDVYVQVIDDVNGKTLASASSKKDGSGKAGELKGKTAESFLVGKAIAEKVLKLNIKKVIFDRGGNTYHGRIKAVADGAREGGLEF